MFSRFCFCFLDFEMQVNHVTAVTICIHLQIYIVKISQLSEQNAALKIAQEFTLLAILY